jgi:hypothetical protein
MVSIERVRISWSSGHQATGSEGRVGDEREDAAPTRDEPTNPLHRANRRRSSVVDAELAHAGVMGKNELTQSTPRASTAHQPARESTHGDPWGVSFGRDSAVIRP